jgi:hypothetical protein
VKSGEDFPAILAADNPDVWRSHRPAEGGATGAMLREIVEQAAALKAGRTASPPKNTKKAAAKPTKPPRIAAAPATKSRGKRQAAATRARSRR